MRVALLVFGLLVAWVGTAAAQSMTTGAIQGVVRDKESGEVLPGVTVTIGNQWAVTDGDGAYKITEVLPGTYDIEFAFEKTSVVRSNVHLGANDVVNVNQRMTIGEAIHIEDHAGPRIRTDQGVKDKRIDREQIEKLPNPGAHAEDTLGSIPGTSNDGTG